jgi:N-6 DNA Methylase
VVVPPSDSLDRASDHLPTDGRRRSAATAIQDWLNAQEGCLWGFCCNGERLRLVRDNASLTRPAYIEADLRQIFDAESFADFTVIWLLIHASRFGAIGTPASDCALEHWREAGGREGAAARERLRHGVEAALKALGAGFLTSNPDLRQRVQGGDLPLSDFFGQLLRLIYRLIFLLAAEDRGLLHEPDASPAARTLYGQGYSLSSLRDRAIRRTAWDAHHDKWEGLVVVFAALARGEELLGLPALGGLFAPDMMPALEMARLTNRALMQAIFALAWLREDAGLVPVNWRDMETEELGSVYESLLELIPRLADDGREFAFAKGDEAKGHARKTSGSYYTPDSLVQLLLDSTLDPVLNRVEAESDDPATALLGVTVIDPACGSGHFLLAAGRRMATRLARARSGGVASAEEYRHALRDVARACLHGVDQNPMAVELCKVALWIEALEPGRPLTFLDNHIRCGDSLIGIFDFNLLRTGLPDEAFDSLTGDDKAVAKAYAAINKEQRDGKAASGLLAELCMPAEIASGAEKLLAMPEDTLDEVEAKRQSFQHLISGPTWWRLKAACDMYVAAFLMPKRGDIPDPREAASLPIPTTEAIWRTVQGGDIRDDVQVSAIDVAMKNRAFHWPLEFPYQTAKGGFDVVIGNPPWERVKLQEQEFFAARDVEIASAPNKAERDKLIKALKEAEPGTPNARLSEEFELAKRAAEAASIFMRKSGRFPLTGIGDVNTYALFAEHFASLARKEVGTTRSGRAGVIVPTGIATDSSTSAFFGDLVANRKLFSLYDFQTGLGFFDDIGHARFKFCLLTVGQAKTGPEAINLSFFSRTLEEFGDKRRHFTLTPAQILELNPNTATSPIFRTESDAVLTRKLYHAVPVLIRERSDHPDGDDNPWGITFQRLFDMSTDSKHFETAQELAHQGFHREGQDWRHLDGRRYVPLFEAKMIHHFDHRFGSYAGLTERSGEGSLPLTPDSIKNSGEYEAEPWYWVPEAETALRVARVPARLKQYYRKEDAKGCLKVLAEWLLGTLDEDDFTKPALVVERAEQRLKEILGPRALTRDVIGAKIAAWVNKIAANALAMQRETPLSEDDLSFIRQGPPNPLELTGALIERKQPRWLMGWRDICHSTNERTVIATVFPKAAAGDKILIMHHTRGVETAVPILATLTSLTLDYVARQKLGGTSFKYYYVKQLAIPGPAQFTKKDFTFLKGRVLQLTYTSYSMRPWAEDLGYLGLPFGFDPEHRAQLRAELDAFLARKYGVTRDELRYILEPADVMGANYPSETFRGLKRNEQAAFGEYRTQRLVLDAWDRMERGELSVSDAGTVVRPAEPVRPPRLAAIDAVALPDLAWARIGQPQPGDTGAALAAVLKASQGPKPSREIRLAAALALEPRLVVPLLSDSAASQWRRLVGTEADPLPGSVIGFATRVNAAWGAAVRNLRGNGRLIENPSDGTWTPGSGLEAIDTTGWPDGRASFVLHALSGIDLTSAVSTLPNEIQQWVADVAAA